jgi:hypothetical protein
VLGLVKSLIGGGKPKESIKALSPLELEQKLAWHRGRLTELKRRLPTEAGEEAVQKSRAWRADMEKKASLASLHGRLEEAARLTGELRAHEKRNERMMTHIENLKQEIVSEEDAIEILERALAEAGR